MRYEMDTKTPLLRCKARLVIHNTPLMRTSCLVALPIVVFLAVVTVSRRVKLLLAGISRLVLIIGDVSAAPWHRMRQLGGQSDREHLARVDEIRARPTRQA